MHIQVSGQQIDIGDALRTHVDEKLNTGVAKFFDHTIDAVVSFTRERERFLCNVAVHVYSGLIMRADAAATEIYAAFDAAAAHRKAAPPPQEPHQGAQGPRRRRRQIARRPVLRHRRRGRRAPHANGEAGEPAIIARSPASVATLRVGDAVMQLDVSGAPVLLFRNAGNGGLNVVYRRADGHVGWIDPAFDPAAAR